MQDKAPINQKEIRTDRLILRELAVLDWKMVSYLRSDNEINQFVTRPSAETKEKAFAFILDKKKDIQNHKLYYWVISDLQSTNMLGSICLWNFSKNRKTAEVGYDLAPIAQGKGLMNLALQQIIKFGFQELKLNCIEAYTHLKNTPSISLLEKNRFKLIEGKKDQDNQNNIIFELRKVNY